MNSRTIAILAALFIAAVPAAPGQSTGTVPAGSARALEIGPGDAVRIAVWRVPELSGEFEVGHDGHLVHPLYREISVAGAPLETIEQRIREFLARYGTDPQFVVEPLLRVAVGGEVRTPSVYSLPTQTTIAQAVAIAGGHTPTGNPRRVRVHRAGDELTVDLTSPHIGLASTPIRSGDQILVQRRTSFFRDVVVPAASITSAVVTILNFATRRR